MWSNNDCEMTSQNQLTQPKAATAVVGSTENSDVETHNSETEVTPVHIRRGDVVRAKLADRDLSDQDIADAITWSRKPAATSRKK